MINFLLNVPKSNRNNLNHIENQKFLKEDEFVCIYSSNSLFTKLENNEFTLLAFGDLINSTRKKLSELFKCMNDSNITEAIHSLKGHFYIIIFSKQSNKLFVINSLFSILPIYYYERSNSFIISNNLSSLQRQLKDPPSLNKVFILERILFNYSFLVNTIYTGHQLVPSNSYIKIQGQFEIIKHTNIEDYFTNNPKPWEKSLESVSESFIDNLKYYVTEDINYSTLTGGFDGRTLVGYLHSQNKEYETFSYGSKTDKDVQVPKMLSEKIGFHHQEFIIDENYSKTKYINSLELFLKLTDGNASLNRHHYAYVASEMAKVTSVFLSGNFGSESLRTMRIPGVMTSDFLFEIFISNSEIELESSIRDKIQLRGLNITEFEDEIKILVSQIMDYKRKLSPDLSLNQKFYVYLFEEVFRKYFGPEFIVQQGYKINNRSPYLDFEFLKKLLETGLAGANGNFKEKNPFIRFRGQILYSYILNRLKSPFGDYPTDRGYRPKDFFSKSGKINIVKNYLKNRFSIVDKSYTTYNELCFNSHRDYFLDLNFDSPYFNSDYLKQNLDSQNIAINHILSLIIYQNLLGRDAN